jgi:hypothetical protein
MKTRITLSARIELTRAVRVRYHCASGGAKHQILAEFVAVSGYHPKSALRILNQDDESPRRPSARNRAPLYDEAARQALIVLWEASDRVCGKRLKPLLRILVPALERHGHLKLDEAIRMKVLAMSAATIDRLLRVPKAATGAKKRRRIVPEIRRRIPVRTFADWKEPPPGSMEMDLVAHCGDVNRGSYVHSLVLTDIASAWTECTPLVVREKTLLVEALERVRVSLPFVLRALDVDNGSEFINETLIEYCIGHGIELTRSRPYRKNDQAWIEQKNGAVVRRMIGYRRFEGLATAQALARLYAVSRFFVNFFQPSFKLAEKSREGAQVTKRYHLPQTPCERLLAHDTTSDAVKSKLREVADKIDPLQLLEEIRAMQSHLVVLADGGQPYQPSTAEQDMEKFLASLSSAWRAGEIRPTHTRETTPPAYIRRIELVVPAPPIAISRDSTPKPVAIAVAQHMESIAVRPGQNPKSPTTPATVNSVPTGQTVVSAVPCQRRKRPHAFNLVWPEICRRLEACPNLNACELFDQLRSEYPGRYLPGQINALQARIKVWRIAAAERGVVIGPLKYRTSGRPRTWRTRIDPLESVWPELCLHLDTDPDQTGRELLNELRSRYPDRYRPGLLRTLQRRLQIWRAQAARRLVFGVTEPTILFRSCSLPSQAGDGCALDESGASSRANGGPPSRSSVGSQASGGAEHPIL